MNHRQNTPAEGRKWMRAVTLRPASEAEETVRGTIIDADKGIWANTPVASGTRGTHQAAEKDVADDEPL